jgi:putative two-component system response regulator
LKAMKANKYHKNNGRHVLIVDDEEAIQMVLNAGITRAGFECLVAGNSQDALRVLEDHHIDVVITDVNMPGMNGDELTKIVKEKHDTDVIIMTGYVDDFTYEKAIETGASDFIEKPVGLQEMVVRLKRVLKEREVQKERDRANEELGRSLMRLRRAIDGAVQAIALTVEARDPYTAGHQSRVAELACAIATHIDLTKDHIEGIRIAARIHDLGKICVPAEILTKPTRLTEIEFSLIKTHAQVGYDILKSIDFPWPIAEIVRQHHERMDGSGYPQGLPGKDILMEARILAVADVVEAMASHRPYRPCCGVDKALEEITKQRGILYDKGMVDACLKLFHEKRFQFESSWK